MPAGAERARGPRRRAGSGPLRLKAKKDEKQPQNGGFSCFGARFGRKMPFLGDLWAIFRIFCPFSCRKGRTARRRRKRAHSRAFACGAQPSAFYFSQPLCPVPIHHFCARIMAALGCPTWRNPYCPKSLLRNESSGKLARWIVTCSERPIKYLRKSSGIGWLDTKQNNTMPVNTKR